MSARGGTKACTASSCHTDRIEQEAHVVKFLPDRLLAPLFVLALVLVIAFSSGGYFPTSWSWSAAGSLCVSLVAVLVLDCVSATRSELSFLAALAALTAWTGISALWSDSAGRSILELQRTFSYFCAAAAIVVLGGRRSPRLLLGALLAAIVTVSIAALLAGLVGDERTNDRLSGAVGYWNGLGAIAAAGCVVALGFAAQTPVREQLAAAAVPILVVTLFLTYSRGAWLALMVGVVTWLALERRPRAVGVALAVAVPAAAGVALCAWANGIVGAAHRTGRQDGWAVAIVLVFLSAAAVYAARGASLFADRHLASRFTLHGWRPRLLLAVSALILVLGAGGAFMAVASSTTALPATHSTEHLLSTTGSGRPAYWRVAWREFRGDPVLGSGAGTFELAWDRERPVPFDARDAHNLYLETLAEVGPLGLVLLVAALGLPLLAALDRRAAAIAPLACGAYVTVLVHAAIDWDWELPAAMLVGVITASCLVGAVPDRTWRLDHRLRAAVGAAMAVALCAVAAWYVGNRALARAYDAISRGELVAAEHSAKTAANWQPWSIEPLLVLGQVEFSTAKRAAARRRFRTAAAKDPKDWRPWRGLALSTTGREARNARAHVQRLNPFGG